MVQDGVIPGCRVIDLMLHARYALHTFVSPHDDKRRGDGARDVRPGVAGAHPLGRTMQGMTLRFEGALVRAGRPDLPDARIEVGDDGRVRSLEQATGGTARKVLVPGFANGHSHAGMAALRGLGDGLPLLEWLRVVMAAESLLTEDDVLWSLRLSLAEMIRGGTTAVADAFLWNERLVEAAVEAGIRVAPGVAVFGPEGVPYEAAGGQPLDGQIAMAERIGEAFRGHPLVRPTYGVHAVYTSGPEVFARVAERAAGNGMGVQVHLSESPAEVAEALAARGETPIETAARTGLLTPSTVIAHAVHATDDDLALIAASGASIVHNPGSNLKLGSGIARVTRMREAGIRVALGTDGPASNDALDPLRELRLALQLQRGSLERADALSVDDGLEMLTVNGYEALGFEPTALEPGDPADLVAVSADSVHAEPFHSPSGFLGWVATGADVTDVVVAGRPLLRDGELLTLDEERIRYEVARIAARLR